MGGRLSLAAAVMAFVLGSLALACRGDEGGSEVPAADDKSVSASTVDDTGNHRDAWARIEPAGDCHCANGSEFAFWERRADPKNVVLFLNGGGVCWDATSCAFTSTDSPGENDSYSWSLASTEPGQGTGIFDFTNANNPFADYSFIYVSSCTGDAHLGDSTMEYSPELTVEHNGYTNSTTALSYLAENYPDAQQVVVIGKTAGSIAAPIYGGLVADLLPDAAVTVFGAQSGAWPDNADFNADILDTRWGVYSTMPAWDVNEGLGARHWSIPEFWVLAGLHDPDLVLARFDFALDPHAAVEVTQWMHRDPPDLLAEIDGNEAAIEAAGVDIHSYTAPGDDHGIFEYEKFYEIRVNGVRFVDWLDALINGESPEDVHCDNCEP